MPSGGVVTRASGEPKPKERKAVRVVLLIVAALVVAVGIGYLGWLIRGSDSHDVRVSSTFTGTVTLVGNQGSSGCVKPSRGGKPICAGFYTEPGTVLRVGQKVHAAEEWAKDGSGGEGNLLLIYTAGG